MFKEIFGNDSAGKVLAYLYFATEANPSSIAHHFDSALDPVIRQLERFTRADVLEKRASHGRAQVYSFRRKGRLVPLIKKIVEALIADLPKAEREKLRKLEMKNDHHRH